MKVSTFLKKVRDFVNEGNLEIIETRKNMNTKRKYGWTVNDQETMILMLEPKDLVEGPVLDLDITSEDVWIFKRKYEGIAIKIYIKLKIRNNKQCICMSIHEDEE